MMIEMMITTMVMMTMAMNMMTAETMVKTTMLFYHVLPVASLGLTGRMLSSNGLPSAVARMERENSKLHWQILRLGK